MKILVLSGGNSPERQVSLRSGKSVSAALEESGHNVRHYDPANGYAGLDDFIGQVDVVFPILHGAGGEDGEIQKELDARGFKYLGSDAKASELCFDKVATKDLLDKLGMLTPRSEIVGSSEFETSPIKASGRYVLKPIEGGSTIDSFIVKDAADQVELDIFNQYPKMLLEELIEGNEITVPVLGDKALPVIEIIPPAGKDFDYENKYNGQTQELCPPKNINSELQSQAQEIAEKLHRAAGVRHLSRTDIIIDSDNKLWVLEINTMPGMTDQSLFPKAAAVSGVSMSALVDRFVQMAL